MMDSVEFECKICYEVSVSPQTLFPCQHSVCLYCLDQWTFHRTADRNQSPHTPLVTCPMCRSPIESHSTDQEFKQKILASSWQGLYEEREATIAIDLSTRDGERQRQQETIQNQHRDLDRTDTQGVLQSQAALMEWNYAEIEICKFRVLLVIFLAIVTTGVLAALNVCELLSLPFLSPLLPFMARDATSRLRYVRFVGRLIGRMFCFLSNPWVEVLVFYVTLVVSTILWALVGQYSLSKL